MDNLLIPYNPYYEKWVIERHVRNGQLKHFIRVRLRHALRDVQEIRNEATHGRQTPREVCDRYRAEIVGIGSAGLLCDLVSHRRTIG